MAHQRKAKSEAGEPAGAVADSWARIVRWYKNKHPELFGDLNGGATNQNIETLETAISQQLPPDVKESYLLHDGQREGSKVGILFGLRLLPLSAALRHWKDWAAIMEDNDELKKNAESHPEGAIQLDYTNPGWIPLTSDSCGNHIGIDLAPGPKGVRGQVIVFGRDEDRKCVAAANWSGFLSDIAAKLESGNDWGSKKHFHDIIKQAANET